MAVDKNLPAMLDEKAYTIHVCFQSKPGQVPAPLKPKGQLIEDVFNSESTPEPIRDGWYTYVTNIQGLKPGMLVTVPVKAVGNYGWTEKYLGNVYPNRIRVAVIMAVDDEVTIEPNSDIRYHWVIGAIDLTHYNELIDRNHVLESQYASAYKHNARRQFASQVLAQLPEDARVGITALLRGEK